IREGNDAIRLVVNICQDSIAGIDDPVVGGHRIDRPRAGETARKHDREQLSYRPVLMVPPLANMGRWPPGTAARNPSFCQPNAQAASSVSQSRLASEDAIDSCHGYHVHQASRLCCAGTLRRFQDAPRLVQVAALAALEEALCSSRPPSVQPKRPERGTCHNQPALQSIEPMANLPC